MRIDSPKRKVKIEWEFNPVKKTYVSKKNADYDLFKKTGESDKYVIKGKIPFYIGVHVREGHVSGQFIGRPLSTNDLGTVRTFHEGFTILEFETRNIENLELEVWFYHEGV